MGFLFKIIRFFFRWTAQFNTQCSFNILIRFKKWRLPRRYEPCKLYEMDAGEAHSKFGIQISYCRRQCVLPQSTLSQHPTCNARKGEMLFWLDKRGIRYSSDMTKAELYDLIKMHTAIWDFCNWLSAHQAWTHTVIRLPPYHPDLTFSHRYLNAYSPPSRTTLFSLGI